MMRTPLWRVMTLASTAILFASACDEVPTGTPAEDQSPQFAAGGEKGKPIDWVWAIGEFTDAPGDRIMNDDLGVPYDSRFRPEPNGSFAMSAYDQDRTFYFDFPEDPDLGDLPADGHYAAYSSTGGDNLLAMEVGTEIPTSYAFLWYAPVEGYDETVTWWLRLGTKDCNLDVSDNRQVLVAHPTETTWTLRADPTKKALLCRSRLKHEKGKGALELGEFYMPFEISITSPPPE